MADSTVFEYGDGEVPRKTRPPSGHPKTIDMVLEAIRESNDKPRKGTSVASVKKWISEHYPEIDQAKLKFHLKNALTKALATGQIERPRGQEDYTAVLVGRFKLGKPPKPAAKSRSIKVLKEVKAKPVKKMKSVETESRIGRSTTPKKASKKPIPRARARSVSATPRVSKSKKIRSRLSKSHSPLRTPKPIKPKPKVAAAKKKTISPAAKKVVAKPTRKSAKKSPVGKTAAKASKTAKAPAKTTKTAKGVKAAAKDTGKKKK